MRNKCLRHKAATNVTVPEFEVKNWVNPCDLRIVGSSGEWYQHTAAADLDSPRPPPAVS